MKKRHFTLAIFLLITSSVHSQKEFFRSKQVFTEDQLRNFISAIAIQNDIVLFNANDYYLYAYNKRDGSLKWLYETSYKYSTVPFVQDSIVYTGVSINDNRQSAQIDLTSGKLIKTLPFGPLTTKPFIKNGILYGTAVYNFGCVIGYDIKKDTVTWSRFIAHGVERQPYYLENEILANAEGNNWVRLGYDGVLIDTTCAVKADVFVEDLPCTRKFTALSHDGLEINDKLSDRIFGDYMGRPEMITTEKFTYALNADKLSIISKKLKIKQQVEVTSLAADLGIDYTSKLLKADNENVWLLYSDHLLKYNHKTKKLIQSTNLAEWQPHQVLLDEENIWLISSKNGLLYGLSLE